ncbi:hypothetical protein ACE193_05520 [Bernardetia sp. OM2101]|uniref:hypothetical protein n=1 Tax=Bernardetia sp. OM2101 TaxID=3344876 RepID=UPI0035D0AB84
MNNILRITNAIFYGAITFILVIALSVFYFFGSKFLEKDSDLVGEWKIEQMSSALIEGKKYYSEEQKQILLQRDSVLLSKKKILFLNFETSSFIFRDTNNGKLESNFFETEKPISWHYLKEKKQIALYRHKEPNVFWEVITLSSSMLEIKTIYGNRKWVIKFSRVMRM